MQAKNVTPLNARINNSLRRAFDIAVARRGVTKQEAVEEALRLWLRDPHAGQPRPRLKPPRITGAKPNINVTGRDLDELLSS
jgi:hypothetical protein